MITMKDVAKKAGTSVFTVSTVINHTGPVSEKLKKIVLKTIKELNYTPNSIARSLKSKKSYLIGLIISDIEDIFFPKVIKGVEEIINKNNMNIILCNTMNDPATENKYLQIMTQKRVDGLILFSSASNNTNLKKFLNNKIPTILIDREIESSKTSTVLMDDYNASLNITNYLIKKGHRRIGAIIFPTLLSTGNKRLKGYINSHNANNMNVDQELIKITGFKKKDSFKAGIELLSLKNKPTAIFTANDIMLSGTLEAINKKNLKIPDDISIVTFFDFDWLEYLNPPITAVKLPTFEMGKRAAELLIDLINSDKNNYQRKIILKTKLIKRNSVKDINL